MDFLCVKNQKIFHSRQLMCEKKINRPKNFWRQNFPPNTQFIFIILKNIFASAKMPSALKSYGVAARQCLATTDQPEATKPRSFYVRLSWIFLFFDMKFSDALSVLDFIRCEKITLVKLSHRIKSVNSHASLTNVKQKIISR